MDVFARAERLMGMDDSVWARHANPWSAWTRFTCLPLIVLALWSRGWLGWWALTPLAAALAWTWWNPRAFAPPRTCEAQASRGVLGERLWLSRAERPIPEHHRRAGLALTAASAIGAVPLVYGVAALDIWPTVFGLVLTMGAKMWFVDRMVWLHDETAASIPRAEGTPR